MFTTQRLERVDAERTDVCGKTPSPPEELRVLRRYYKEHIINNVACSGDIWEPKYNAKRRKYSSEDEDNRQKTKYEGSHSTVYYDPAEEYDAYQITCRIMIMILLLA